MPLVMAFRHEPCNGEPAIYRDALSGNVARAWRREEHHGGSHLTWFTIPRNR